jgi:hypothetical protein
VPDPLTSDGIITIKVTTNDLRHNYFVHFNRDGCDLIDVCEYKPIYTPVMGRMPRRIKEIVDTAHAKALETQGVKQ